LPAETGVLEAPLDLAEPAPDAALCAAPVTGLEATGALWWHGRDLGRRDWPARLGGVQAVPTDPNDDNAGVGQHGREAGLQCRAGVHCGFVAPDAVPEARTATLAVRWVTPPGAEARTLLTLNMGGAARRGEGENYLFLSEAEGILTAKDDAGLVEASLPCPATGTPHLAVASLKGTALRLFLDGTEAAAEATAPVLQGPASLFVAARNQRPKLLKTLGDALILDVWLWPGRALLHEPGRPLLTALRRHHLWAGE
jgi:hypothetical protein